MGTGQAFVLLETAATLFMAGVLWTMQLLNYPLLAHHRPARPLQLDTTGRLVGGGRYRPVDVPSGVHAVSGHGATPHPGGATPGSRSARYRDRPGGRCQHTRKGRAR